MKQIKKAKSKKSAVLQASHKNSKSKAKPKQSRSKRTKRATKRVSKRMRHKRVPAPAFNNSLPHALLPLADASYNEALIANVLSGNAKKKVDGNSITFGSVICSLSPKMREMHYKTGFSLGKSIYTSINAKKRYRVHGEGIDYLVNFMENMGYGAITYSTFPEQTKVCINPTRAFKADSRMHSFESGIIAGFISASRRMLIHVKEEACTSNSSETCNFVTTSHPDYSIAASDATIINKFMEHLDSYINGNAEASPRELIPEEYHALLTSPIVNGMDSDSMRNVMAYAGNALAKQMGINSGSHKRISAYKIRKIESAMRVLNMGKIEIKSLNPIRINVAFDALTSKREYVDASLAFLSGILNPLVSKTGFNVETACVNKNDAYHVKITEKRATR